MFHITITTLILQQLILKSQLQNTLDTHSTQSLYSPTTKVNFKNENHDSLFWTFTQKAINRDACIDTKLVLIC